MKYLLKLNRKKELGIKGQIKFNKLYHKHIYRFGPPMKYDKSWNIDKTKEELVKAIKEAETILGKLKI